MCTLAYWVDDDGGMNILFNRDEARIRPLADPPALHEDSEGCRRIFSRDPQGGGTWLAVNTHGTVGVVLSDYRSAAICQSGRGPVSRGQLPLQSTGFRNFDQLANWWAELPAEHFNPFKLLVLRRACLKKIEVIRATWNGARKHWSRTQCVYGYETSSSLTPDLVEPYRMQLLKRKRASRAGLAEWIQQLSILFSEEDPDNADRAILMDRPDTRTVSQTRVRVSDTSVDFQYRQRRPESGFFAPVAVHYD